MRAGAAGTGGGAVGAARPLASPRSRRPLSAGRFFGTFRDGQYVYLLLEFCQGGELWTKLREMYGDGVSGGGSAVPYGTVPPLIPAVQALL